MAALNFDPNQFEPLGEGYTVYPAGTYVVAIKSSEVKANAAGDGGYLLLNEEILDGPHKGGNIQHRLNIYNSNEQAKEIASRALTSVCFAVNFHAMLQDSSQLHGIPFQVRLEERELPYRANDDRSKPPKKANEVVAIMDAHGNAPGKPAQGGAAPSGAPSSAPASAPAAQPAAQPAADPAPAAQPAAWTPPATAAPAAQPAAQPGGWTPPAAGATPPPAAPWGAPAA